jgi:hypothetical protein
VSYDGEGVHEEELKGFFLRSVLWEDGPIPNIKFSSALITTVNNKVWAASGPYDLRGIPSSLVKNDLSPRKFKWACMLWAGPNG